MNHDTARLARLAARIKRRSPRFIEQARDYMSMIDETLADSPASAFPELRRFLRDARREGLTPDQIAVKLLNDLYVTVQIAEVEDINADR
jgi:hypothetical protein